MKKKSDVKSRISDVELKLSNNANWFDDDTEKFNLKNFLKLLDKESTSKKHIQAIMQMSFNELPDVFDYVIKSSTKNNTEYTKLLKRINNYYYSEFFDYLYEEGRLLPLVSGNFDLEKIYRVREKEDEYYVDYTLQIISSKINKTFYVLASRNNVYAAIFGLHYLKKFKDKKKAIVFIKKLVQKVKDSNKERIKLNKYWKKNWK